jgi:hypothetical protein
MTTGSPQTIATEVALVADSMLPKRAISSFQACGASRRVYFRHVTPEWELQANFRLPYANYLKTQRLCGTSLTTGPL